MPHSSTISLTLILFSGCSFKSFIKEAFIACSVKFGMVHTSLGIILCMITQNM